MLIEAFISSTSRVRFYVQVVRFLEVGIVLDHEKFPEFRHVFEPSEIMWDIDPTPLKQRALEIEQGA